MERLKNIPSEPSESERRYDRNHLLLFFFGFVRKEANVAEERSTYGVENAF